MSPESIAALFTGVVALLGGIGALITAVVKVKNSQKVIDKATDIKSKRAESKLQDEQHTEIVNKWHDLYNTLNGKVEKLANEHLDCQIKLATFKTQFYESQKNLEDTQKRFMAAETQLNSCRSELYQIQTKLTETQRNLEQSEFKLNQAGERIRHLEEGQK